MMSLQIIKKDFQYHLEVLKKMEPLYPVIENMAAICV